MGMFYMNYVTAATQAGADDKIIVFPVWSTFVILLVVVVELMTAGIFLKRKWLEKHEALPIPAALAMLLMMMSLYVLVGSALYFSSSVQQRPQILFWLFILYIPLGIQYALNVVNAIVWFSTRRVAPIGDEVPDAPVLTLAQKQVMAGKIDDAIATFTHFYERRAPALAEVARLLKTEGKFDQAIKLYVDLVENHASDRVIWPEAVYTLGKIYETQMGKAQEAIKLYKRLLDDAPESRFTHLAGADMARLMVMDASFIRSLNEDDDQEIKEDPFFAQRRNFLLQRMQQRERMEQLKDEEREEEEDGQDEAADEEEIPEAGYVVAAEIDVPVRGKTGIKKKAGRRKNTQAESNYGEDVDNGSENGSDNAGFDDQQEPYAEDA